MVKIIKRIYKKHELLITIRNADEMDETEYLLASEANRKALEEAIKNVEEGKLIEVDIDKYLSSEKGSF